MSLQDVIVPDGHAAPEDLTALYRRAIRRETRVSRAAAHVVAVVVLVLLAAVVVFAGVVALLDQRVLGIDPREAIDSAVNVPRHGVAVIVAVAGAVAAIIGLSFLLLGLLPRRRPRHAMPAARLAVVIDDEVIASAMARAARAATRLGRDSAVGAVGRRNAEVIIRPAAGVDVPIVSAGEAVDAELAEIDAVPPLTPRVRVQPTGRVDG